MGIPAQRFSMLNSETNVAVSDFQKITNSGIFNNPANATSLLGSKSLALSDGFIKNNKLPDIGTITAMAGSLLSILGGANGKLSINSIMSLIAKSPLISSAIRNAVMSQGPSGLNTVLGVLLSQIGNGSILSNPLNQFSNTSIANMLGSTPNGNSSVSSNVDFSGALYGVTGVNSTVSDLSNMVTGNGALSTGMIPINTRMTQDPSTTISLANNSTLNSSQVNTLIATLIPNNPTLVTALKTLSPAMQSSILSDVSIASETSTVNVNGVHNNINSSSDTTQFIAAINKLAGVVYAPTVSNTNLTSSLITSFVSNNNSLGLPPLFSTIIAGFTDTTGIVNAGSVLINSASKQGDINSILDIANTPHINAISSSTANLTNNIVANIVIPANTSDNQLSALMNDLINSLSAINPNWITVPGTSTLTLSNFDSFSKDFKTLLNASVNSSDYSIPDLTTIPTGGNYPSLVSAVTTPQLLTIALGLGIRDVMIEITNDFGMLPIIPDTQLKSFTINSPIQINGIQIIDNHSGINASV